MRTSAFTAQDLSLNCETSRFRDSKLETRVRDTTFDRGIVSEIQKNRIPKRQLADRPSVSAIHSFTCDYVNSTDRINSRGIPRIPRRSVDKFEARSPIIIAVFSSHSDLGSGASPAARKRFATNSAAISGPFLVWPPLNGADGNRTQKRRDTGGL